MKGSRASSRKSAAREEESLPLQTRRKWLTDPQTLSTLWWLFHIASILYVIVILGLSIDTQMLSTLAWQRTFSPLVSRSLESQLHVVVPGMP